MSSNETDAREPVADILEDRALARWEIASVFSSILIAEWILSAVAGQTKAVVAIPISLAFIFIIWSHRLRRETLREMGLRFDNFFPALKLLLVPMVVAGLLSGLVGMLAGARMDFWRWHSERPLVGQLALGFTWGLLQQYVLQSFVNRRAQLAWRAGWLSILVTALVFAGLHLPNPWLTVVTFIGGIVWGTVFQRAPNLFALALSHSVMTWILVSTLPLSALNHLRIGFKYFA